MGDRRSQRNEEKRNIKPFMIHSGHFPGISEEANQCDLSSKRDASFSCSECKLAADCGRGKPNDDFREHSEPEIGAEYVNREKCSLISYVVVIHLLPLIPPLLSENPECSEFLIWSP